MPVSLRPAASLPKYCRFKRQGKDDSAYVRIDGKRIMLGRYGCPSQKLHPALVSAIRTYVELHDDRKNGHEEAENPV